MTATQHNIKKQPHILISGGGTGGHIFPALSIAAAIQRRHPESKILFVGAEDRMEMERVPAAGYEIIGLPVSGFYRTKMWRNIKVLFRLWKSIRKARKIIKTFKPDIAIGVGGYASGPTLKAAQRAEIPTLLQEQNSYAGVTNRLLAKKAKAICVAYPDMERFFPADKITLTGNPVRANLLKCNLSQQLAKQNLGFDPEKPLVLVVGGSLGARTINSTLIANALDGDAAANGFQILWQTGARDADRCLEAVKAKSPKGITATPFISNMDIAYRAADLVVARAGAGTISELQLLGKPTILVPSPNVAEDHQRKNAMALVARNAAVMILDADADQKLWSEIIRLTNADDERHSLANNILAMALPQSDEKIADTVDSLLNA